MSNAYIYPGLNMNYVEISDKSALLSLLQDQSQAYSQLIISCELENFVIRLPATVQDVYIASPPTDFALQIIGPQVKYVYAPKHIVVVQPNFLYLDVHNICEENGSKKICSQLLLRGLSLRCRVNNLPDISAKQAPNLQILSVNGDNVSAGSFVRGLNPELVTMFVIEDLYYDKNVDPVSEIYYFYRINLNLKLGETYIWEVGHVFRKECAKDFESIQ